VEHQDPRDCSLTSEARSRKRLSRKAECRQQIRLLLHGDPQTDTEHEALHDAAFSSLLPSRSQTRDYADRKDQQTGVRLR
jgi:hypothetical protein